VRERSVAVPLDADTRSREILDVCGTGGDVFTFVRKFHKMEFREALEYLAQRARPFVFSTAPPPAVGS
jgi:hypothetical protein